MEYNEVKALCERWLSGASSLTEEAALREFFTSPDAGLPADLEPYRLMFDGISRAASLRSNRALILRTYNKQPRMRLTRWFLTAAAGAAAAAVTTVMLIIPNPTTSENNIVCTVNGVRITDPARIAAYTREALEIASDNLNKPGAALSTTLGTDPAMIRVGEMLNELTKTDNQQ
jgi:hypothetical protein